MTIWVSTGSMKTMGTKIQTAFPSWWICIWISIDLKFFSVPFVRCCMTSFQFSAFRICLSSISYYITVLLYYRITVSLYYCLIYHFLKYLNTRVGTLIVATIYLQLIQNRYMFRSFTVLQCSHLSPCDFHLIPKMKEPLRGIRFRTVPEILQAVDRSIRAINTTGAAKGILRLPHRWQRVVHNAGDYTEGQ